MVLLQKCAKLLYCMAVVKITCELVVCPLFCVGAMEVGVLLLPLFLNVSVNRWSASLARECH